MLAHSRRRQEESIDKPSSNSMWGLSFRGMTFISPMLARMRRHCKCRSVGRLFVKHTGLSTILVLILRPSLVCQSDLTWLGFGQVQTNLKTWHPQHPRTKPSSSSTNPCPQAVHVNTESSDSNLNKTLRLFNDQCPKFPESQRAHACASTAKHRRAGSARSAMAEKPVWA